MTKTQKSNTQNQQPFFHSIAYLFEQASSIEEQQFRTILERVGIGIAVANQRGEVIFSNHAYQKLVGYSSEELATIHFKEYTYHEDVENDIELFDQFMAGQIDRYQIEKRYVHKAGKLIWVRLTVTTLPIAQRASEYFNIAIIENIDEQKRGEETLKQKNYRLEVLNQISQLALSMQSLEDILSETAKLCANAVDVTSVYTSDVNFFDQTTTVLSEFISKQASPKEKVSDLGVCYPLQEIFPDALEWFQNPQGNYVVHVDDPDINPIEKAHMEEFGAKTVLSMPVVAENEIIGILELWESRSKREFSIDEMQFVQSVANQIASIIFNFRLQEQRKESEARYKRLFNTPYVGLFLAHVENGKVIACNDKFARILGYENAEICLAKEIHLLNYFVQPALQEQLRSQMTENIENLETIFIRKNGEVFWGSLSAQYYPEQNALEGTLQDISERKNAEKRDFELTLEKERVQILQRYLGDVSHDLRTPLTTMKTMHYLLERSFENPERSYEYLETLGSEIGNLELLLETIMKMIRLENIDTLTFQPINLQEVIAHLIELYVANDHPNVAIQISQDKETIQVMGNAVYLADAIVNLLDNAIKYSSSNTEITIALTKEDSWSILAIQDQGEGIHTEDLPHIFDYFYRGDKARTNRTETGLGLAITKRIVELHHGRIEVESEAGQGSTFRIFLPLYKVFEADF